MYRQALLLLLTLIFVADAEYNLTVLSFDTAQTGSIFLPLPILIQTTSYTCGSTSTAALLQGFGFAVTEMSMTEELHSNNEVGTYYGEIVSALLRRGFSASARNGWTISQIREVLVRGGVVMVCYQAWKEDDGPWVLRWQDGHYSVVIGLDDTNIFLMDPSQDDGYFGYIPLVEFEARWRDIDGTDATGVPVVRFGISVERSDPSLPFLQRASAVPANVKYTA